MDDDLRRLIAEVDGVELPPAARWGALPGAGAGAGVGGGRAPVLATALPAGGLGFAPVSLLGGNSADGMGMGLPPLSYAPGGGGDPGGLLAGHQFDAVGGAVGGFGFVGGAGAGSAYGGFDPSALPFGGGAGADGAGGGFYPPGGAPMLELALPGGGGSDGQLPALLPYTGGGGGGGSVYATAAAFAAAAGGGGGSSAATAAPLAGGAGVGAYYGAAYPGAAAAVPDADDEMDEELADPMKAAILKFKARKNVKGKRKNKMRRPGGALPYELEQELGALLRSSEISESARVRPHKPLAAHRRVIK